MVLNLVLAEASLEVIPKELWNEPSVIAYCRRRRKDPGRCLLDIVYYYRAMRKLKDAEKRGRPDIVHSAMLSALETPLNKEGLLKLYVHTYSNYVIYVDPSVRLPKNYNNFLNLMEQLFELKLVPPRGKPLLTLEAKDFSKLVLELKPDYAVALDTDGSLTSLSKLALKLSNFKSPAVAIGGFQRGSLSEDVKKNCNELLSIGNFSFLASVVISRLIYELELKTGIYAKLTLQSTNPQDA